MTATANGAEHQHANDVNRQRDGRPSAGGRMEVLEVLEVLEIIALQNNS